MPRYFFHTRDGQRHIDDEGWELPDDMSARREAVRYGGSLLADDPDMLLGPKDFRVDVSDEDGALRFAVVMVAVAPVRGDD
jgi:hypothetical protein